MTERKFKRRIKLIKPGLQVRLIGAFTAVAVIALLLQYLLVAQHLTWTATRLPVGGEYLMDEIPQILMQVLGISFAVLLPLAFAIGVIATFKVAGPVYRFERYMSELAEGRDPGVCRLRQGDELQDLCDKINDAREAHWAERPANARLDDEASKDETAILDEVDAAAETVGAEEEQDYRQVS